MRRGEGSWKEECVWVNECTWFTLCVHYACFLVFSLQMPTTIVYNRAEWRYLTLILLSYILVCSSLLCRHYGFMIIYCLFLQFMRVDADSMVAVHFILCVLFWLFIISFLYNSIFHCDFSNINFITFIQIIARMEMKNEKKKITNRLKPMQPNINKQPSSTFQFIWCLSQNYGTSLLFYIMCTCYGMGWLNILNVRTNVFVVVVFFVFILILVMRMDQTVKGWHCLHVKRMGINKWYAVLQKNCSSIFTFYFLFITSHCMSYVENWIYFATST